ncbi:MAG: DUF6249 domain-containing protein [Xanthomonadales bacterium]|nr:DUF6249 domain-containing protein [Xanthomonadales bacterium]
MTLIDSGMGWAIFGAAFIFIFILIGVLGEHLRQKRKLERQELLQRERIAMLDKGVPLPDWNEMNVDEDGERVSGLEAHERRKQWFRLVTLAIGLFLSFAGVGMLLAFNLAPDDSWQDIATVGAIPLTAGVGLLLFYALTREPGA